MIVSWFSAGVSSAVATKLALERFPTMEIRYHHIDDQHEDTMRFVKDCQEWFGCEIKIDQSPYRSVENACLSACFLKGPHGAACSRLLKKRLGKLWEMENPGRHLYVWGLDCGEVRRKEGFARSMADHDHLFPLFEARLSKCEVHGLLENAGIKRPAMYDLGYPNNNCIGCIRGGMRYWAKIKSDFPNVYEARARLERKISPKQHIILKRCYLDEFDGDCTGELQMIVPDCGRFCEIEEAPSMAQEPPQNTKEDSETASNSRKPKLAKSAVESEL